MATTNHKAHTALDEGSDKGEFIRVDSSFRNNISVDDDNYQPEANRYHLYVSYACPWAHRTLIARKMKGLEDVIGVSVVHPTWQRTKPDDPNDTHTGWIFKSPSDAPLSNTNGYGSYPCDGCIPDTIHQSGFIRDLYERSNDTLGKYSVPVLWDKKTSTIVNNESEEILRIFNTQFNHIAKKKDVDFFPEDLRDSIKEINSWVYPYINNGVYRCGFAKSQEAYEKAFKELFENLERAETLLSKNRYLCGNRFTEADIRLFVTLIRFDEVYTVYFKSNLKHIREYPNLLNYMREIYQMEGVKETVNMTHIKTHYYSSHPVLNHYGIIPKGADFEKELSHKHNRNDIV